VASGAEVAFQKALTVLMSKTSSSQETAVRACNQYNCCDLCTSQDANHKLSSLYKARDAGAVGPVQNEEPERGKKKKKKAQAPA
jgi:alkylhydroperoxidase family enzyme